MKSARRILLRRSGTILPVVALAVTASVGVLTGPGPDAPVRTRPVSFANGNPIGSAKFTKVPGGVRITGWAFDPSKKTRSLRIVSTVSGRVSRSTVASRKNTTAARRYAKVGSKHGYSLTVPVPEGVRTVCVVAKDVGKGRDTTVGCLRRSTFDYGPYGRLDTAAARPGHVYVAGWLIDNDRRTTPVTARITVDGVARTVVANARRDDVARAYKGAGSRHGFAVSVPVGQGHHPVCVVSRNIGVGSDNTLGCRTVNVNDNPVGELSVGQRSGKLRVAGFAFDRDRIASPLRVTIRVDNGAPAVISASTVRNTLATKYRVSANHGYDQRYAATEGKHTVCVTVGNIGYGTDAKACRTVVLNYTPTVKLTSVIPAVEGLSVRGWATDPDTSAAIPVRLTLDNKPVGTLTANGAGTGVAGHNFAKILPTRSGTHTLCAVAVNQVSGSRDSSPACIQQFPLVLPPSGRFDGISRVGNNVRITGWAYDPDTTSPVAVVVKVDTAPAITLAANQPRSDVAVAYPSAGASRGFASVLTTNDGKHTVCVSLRDVGGNAPRSLGCRLINAVHPTVTSAPRIMKSTPGYGAMGVAWAAPLNDGGAPPDLYRVAAGSRVVTVPSTTLQTTLTGLAAKTSYTITVSAHNVAGWSPAGVTRNRTQSGPAPQTSPAPVSTSRYMRNIRSCSTAEAAEMRGFGAADATRNQSGHRYLQLLDIGGQSSRYGGVMLSAIVRFVSYGNLLRCTKAYVDGYASKMRSSAPAVVAMGVNNDLDVTAATGRAWATQIVNPLATYARRYSGITIAGANDIEPGFSASYSETRSWLSGYLGATNAAFVFNGSADGCAWTVTNRGCNNGWNMAGLYNLAAGMAPTRTINLPQIYNYTMADQWKYISLTGIGANHPRINFGGPLTEAVACAQANHSCGSISGRSAWQRLWNNLQSHPKLRVGSLPYATDLRIDS